MLMGQGDVKNPAQSGPDRYSRSGYRVPGSPLFVMGSVSVLMTVAVGALFFCRHRARVRVLPAQGSRWTPLLATVLGDFDATAWLFVLVRDDLVADLCRFAFRGLAAFAFRDVFDAFVLRGELAAFLLGGLDTRAFC
jgi:hypothetical protein